MFQGYRSRKRGNRKEAITALIICEGQKTEPNYFNNYKEPYGGLKIIIPNSTRTDPVNLVKFALKQNYKYQIDTSNGDTIWCVFDADTNSPEKIEQAKKLAKGKINLCFSNPCFELWYFLHFCYLEQRISTGDLQDKLKKYIKNYNKTKDYYKILLSKRQNAIEYTKKLNNKHIAKGIELLSAKSNPSSGVVDLVEYMLKTIKKNKEQHLANG